VYFIQAMAEIGGMFGAVRPWQGASILSFSTLCIWPHSTIGQTSSVNIPCRLARPQGGAFPPPFGLHNELGNLGALCRLRLQVKKQHFRSKLNLLFRRCRRRGSRGGQHQSEISAVEEEHFCFLCESKKGVSAASVEFFCMGGRGRVAQLNSK